MKINLNALKDKLTSQNSYYEVFHTKSLKEERAK